MTIFLGTALFLLVGCKSENERRIVGKWQALQLTECDNVVPIQTELVDIEFMSNGKYIFHSTLNVKEEGVYKIRKNFLFTQDKMREKAPEKVVLIQTIEDDTLVLQMSYKGKDQWLTLVKESASEKAKVNIEDQAVANVTSTPTTVVSAATLVNNPLDSIQKAEEKKKQEVADKEAERKKEEAAADKKREAEADRKREAAQKESSSSSPAEAYKKREAKRIAEERKAKEEAEKKAAKFRKEYAIREAERKKREARKN